MQFRKRSWMIKETNNVNFDRYNQFCSCLQMSYQKLRQWWRGRLVCLVILFPLCLTTRWSLLFGSKTIWIPSTRKSSPNFSLIIRVCADLCYNWLYRRWFYVIRRLLECFRLVHSQSCMCLFFFLYLFMYVYPLSLTKLASRYSTNRFKPPWKRRRVKTTFFTRAITVRTVVYLLCGEVVFFMSRNVWLILYESSASTVDISFRIC
jgi:hypothetical protein